MLLGVWGGELERNSFGKRRNVTFIIGQGVGKMALISLITYML